MELRNLIIAGLKRPHRIFPFLLNYYRNYRKGVCTFSFDDVVAGTSTLAEFSARLYKESELLKKGLNNVYAARACEIGCGYGRLSPWIKEYCNELYSIDPNVDFVKKAQELYPEVKFTAATAQNLPFPDNFFDLAITWTVLQHIHPKRLLEAVAEIKRVVNSSATLLVVEDVEGESFPNYWPRPVKEYENIFSPWELTLCVKIKLGRTDNDPTRTLMRFEKRA